MKTITLRQAKKITFKQASVALGTFDGLHLGHIALIDAAKKHTGDTIAFTFDTLPIDLFQSQHKPMQLFTMQEKINAFSKTGIDYLCVTHFDHSFAGMDKFDFEKMLVDIFKPVNVIAGYNYTYGFHAEGTAEILQLNSARLGYNAEVISEVLINGVAVSSTKIRELIWNGQIVDANSLLGYQYSMSGEVVRGKGIGKSLGFPTANICASKLKITPKNGVYSVAVHVQDKTYKGVCSIGTNPTVSRHSGQTIETHILDFDEDIYGEIITVSFIKRLRDERRFENVTQLSQQIQQDAKNAAI